MPDYLDTYVDEAHLQTYEGADFDEVCLAGPDGALGEQVWRWTRRQDDYAKACWLRLIVAVDDAHSPAAVTRVREVLQPTPPENTGRVVWRH